ncbi:hypothetical protein D3C87_1584140 [compost metagenome]
MHGVKRLAARAGTAQGEGFPGTVELGIEHAELPIDQKLVTDPVEVGGVGDSAQGGQHTRRHVGITPGAVGRVDDVYKAVIGVYHQTGAHVRGFGGEVGAVAGIAHQVGGGLVRRRRQYQG